ncbi:hypothetical protein BC834DRAFT_871839 [Gloeopeniophorella convolvens]|nr:hypothetical protein BC834DRAFT_871839 [Gloeopeniophorella convolvens]
MPCLAAVSPVIIAFIRREDNALELCRLDIVTPDLHTLHVLELPRTQGEGFILCAPYLTPGVPFRHDPDQAVTCVTLEYQCDWWSDPGEAAEDGEDEGPDNGGGSPQEAEAEDEEANGSQDGNLPPRKICTIGETVLLCSDYPATGDQYTEHYTALELFQEGFLVETALPRDQVQGTTRHRARS